MTSESNLPINRELFHNVEFIPYCQNRFVQPHYNMI